MVDFIQRVIDWLFNFFLWLPRKLWSMILDGFAGFIEAIPVPSFMSNLGDWFGAIPSDIAYFCGPLQVGTGLGFVIAALVLRFVIRRIPFIG